MEREEVSLQYTSVGERQTMQVLRNLGHTLKEIASILNCNKSTVKRNLKNFKLNCTFPGQKKRLEGPKR